MNTTRDRSMRREYLESLRADREPTRRALAMLRAVFAHVEDLMNDDPTDEGFTAAELNAIKSALDRAILTIVERSK